MATNKRRVLLQMFTPPCWSLAFLFAFGLYYVSPLLREGSVVLFVLAVYTLACYENTIRKLRQDDDLAKTKKGSGLSE